MGSRFTENLEHRNPCSSEGTRLNCLSGFSHLENASQSLSELSEITVIGGAFVFQSPTETQYIDHWLNFSGFKNMFDNVPRKLSNHTICHWFRRSYSSHPISRMHLSSISQSPKKAYWIIIGWKIINKNIPSVEIKLVWETLIRLTESWVLAFSLLLRKKSKDQQVRHMTPKQWSRPVLWLKSL